ncbi:MAG: hypothetical protein HXS52_07560 [Theionarchaea archaeon]|nr:hypothetical protein [Theionarchaea archaeon]MBU7037774.1 hypothetical protein [Theionarchaea archaeon]
MQNTVLQSTEIVKHDGGKMSSSAYDTAWVARVTDQQGTSVFPECVQWILENQKQDGSWGSQILDYHDRILSTLSAIIALKELDGIRYKDHIQKGESYIWRNMRKMRKDNCVFVGGELLLPSLMEHAESIGLNLPYYVKVYERKCRAKLEKIDRSLWYSPLTSLSFSFEFLGDEVDVERLPYIRLPNGSVGNSPAATAFYLKHRKDEEAVQYLRRILCLRGDGSVMEAFPIEAFELGWVMYNLMLAGLYLEQYNEICTYLTKNLKPSGIGMSTGFPVPDLDDTAILLKALHRMQHCVDFSIIDEYDMGEYYATYTFEVGASVSTNIHMLDLVKSCPQFPRRNENIDKLIAFIKKEMHSPGYWADKWHISPYYTTSHGIMALSGLDSDLAGKAVSWILQSQNENGKWGRNGGTLEETALALQALMYYHRNVEPIDMEGISKAMKFLHVDVSSLTSLDLPDMWICKVLYTPTRIVQSSIASTQLLGGIENCG